MARNIAGVIAGLVVWFVVAFGVGSAMRASWSEYASVADALAFTLPMMFARLSIGALATVAAGFVTACITQSTIARLATGVILLLVFIPEHVMLWDKFPIWYHLTFLLSLVPLTYVGGVLARGTVIQRRTSKQTLGFGL